MSEQFQTQLMTWMRVKSASGAQVRSKNGGKTDNGSKWKGKQDADGYELQNKTGNNKTESPNHDKWQNLHICEMSFPEHSMTHYISMTHLSSI